MNCPKLCGQNKKYPCGRKHKKLSNELTSLFVWCQFCFELNTFVVVEANIFAYEEARLLIGFEFGAVDTLCFENRKEIFSHSVVIRIPPT